MSEEWGPWIEHDGKGCPCVGQMVMTQYDDGDIHGPVIAGSTWSVPGGSWDWRNVVLHGLDPIIRYRIRKPRGMTILEGLIENLPAPVREEVDA